jgi:hypothetical protein
VVVVVLFTAGDQEPVILLVEVVGNERDAPEQMGPMELKVGAVGGLTLTVKVAVVAHCPAVGVKE